MRKKNAVRFLRDGQKTIRGLLAQSESTASRAREMRAGVMRELCAFLEIHCAIEEELLYPSLREFGETAALVADGEAAHSEIKPLVQRLREPESAAADLDSALKDLEDAVLPHFDAAEGELFPLAEKLMEQKLEALEPRMRRLKSKLLQSPVFADARPELVQNPRGGEQKRKLEAA